MTFNKQERMFIIHALSWAIEKLEKEKLVADEKHIAGYNNSISIRRELLLNFKTLDEDKIRQKEIYVVNAKLKFNDNTEDTIPFHIEANSMGKAETKLREWLLSGNSLWKFTEILNIWADHNIWVIE